MEERQAPSFQHLLCTPRMPGHISLCSSSADLQLQGHVKVQSVLCKAALMAELRSILSNPVARYGGAIRFSPQSACRSVRHPTPAARSLLWLVLTYPANKDPNRRSLVLSSSGRASSFLYYWMQCYTNCYTQTYLYILYIFIHTCILY